LIFLVGLTIRAGSGLEERGHPERMTTPVFYHATKGSRLELADSDYLLAVATYTAFVDEKYIYTYAYEPSQSWTHYNGDIGAESYSHNYEFQEDTYFRVCVKRAMGGELTAKDAEFVSSTLVFSPAPTPAFPVKPFLMEEAAAVAARVRKLRQPETQCYALLADSHYVVNGTWDDTVRSLRRVHELLNFDGIIHLGDLTDGMVSAAATKYYVGKVGRDLRKIGAPLYIALGNHDANYFRGNSEPFSIAEQDALYLERGASGEPGCYCVDRLGLRLIFLPSFDWREEVRYGFAGSQIAWLREALAASPPESAVIVFCHLPPLVRLQYWTDVIRGGEEVYEVIFSYQKERGNVLAYIHGHNHADYICRDAGFPIISIGCAKPECFPEYKPPGAVAPPRRLGDRTQELWDVLLVTPGRGLDFIRYGAGQDKRYLSS
jgi:3',5'-cyclic AMP phosphodiesterase CpdA